MDRDWARLGQAVQAARKKMGLTQAQLGEQLEVSRATVQLIEHGKEFVNVTRTHRALEPIFGWCRGSVEAVLNGGEPTPLSADAPDSATEAEQGEESQELLPLRIRQALGDGHLLDSTVIDLPAEGSDEPDAQIVIVVRSKPDATPERMRQSVAAWERVERQLRAIRAQGDAPSALDDE
ncbi:helix-turn-helix domain-containing protein [Streptomyces syringium]|uniref:helix-turn-helix domain-containing protein n=1 Tax=Streptomyces syringium TaxID=76729 RepID=UPI0037D211D7